MTHDRPTPAELLEAVWEFLGEEVLPAADDHRLKFRTRVAMNAIAIARRELESDTAEGLTPDEVADLAHRVRNGEVSADTLEVLKEHVAAKLRVSNPAYLERYR